MSLSDLERKASSAASEVAELKAVVRQLQARVERQALVLGTLWEVRQDHEPETRPLHLLRRSPAGRIDLA
jgi:hypothetical protein